MSNTSLNYFLARGTNAERLAYVLTDIPVASGPDMGFLWYETDTTRLFLWNGASWDDVGGTSPVAVAVAGALSGDGSAGDPLTVEVDGVTVVINGSNQLEVVSGGGITELTGEVTAGPGTGAQAATIANSVVTNAKMAPMANNTVKGNDSGGPTNPQDLTADEVSTLLDGAADPFVRTSAAGASGINQLTGDVTAGPGTGSQAATIANDAVTFAKMQNINTDRLIGRETAGSGDPEEISLGTRLSMSSTTLNVNNIGTLYSFRFTVINPDVIETGVKRYTKTILTGDDGTITSWDFRSDPAASIEIDVLKNGSSMTNGNNPELVADDHATDTDLSDWTTQAIAAGDEITIEVLSNDLSEFFELTFTVQRTT